MRANVGGLDRVLRIALGIAILAMAPVLQGDARWFALIGFVPLVTGLVGWCPIYPLLGLSTCRAARSR